MIEIPGYRIVSQLGRGGMATVHLAIQESVDREVALKIMSPHLLADPNFGERFLREARIAAKLHHRHVVGVHDVGRHNDLHYIAMEYVAGGPILSKDGQPREVPFALRVTREIATALGYAHSKGFVHRDVKPDNILIRDDGTAALTDFGIARANDSATRMTRTGAVIGTPHYMSPEQARGKQIDGRADLYSLGIVLYEMLVGRVPFHADDSLAVGIMHITEPPPRLPGKLAPLQPMLDRLLAKTPEERYQDGEELAALVLEYERAIANGDIPDLMKPTPEQRRRILDSIPAAARLTPRITPTLTTRAAGGHTTPTPTVRTPEPSTRVMRQEPRVGRTDDLGPQSERRFPTVAMQRPRRGRGGFRTLLLLVLLGAGGTAAWMHQDKLRALLPTTELNTLLGEADKALAAGRLVGSAGLSARELYDQVLKLDPDNTQAIAGKRRVGEQLVAQSHAALARGELETARSLALEARTVLGGGAELDELDLALRDSQSRSVEIGGLIEQALTARRAGKLAGTPDSAIAFYQQALDVDAANAVATRGIQDILNEIATQAEEKLAAGDAAAAAALVDQVAQVSPNHPKVPELRGKLSDQSRNDAAQLETALARAETLLREGRLTTPAGSNALELFRAAIAIDADNARARAGLARIGTSLLVQANAAVDAGDADAAERLVRQAEGVGAPPVELRDSRTRLRELRERAEIAQANVLDAAQQAEVQRLIADAEAAVQAGNLLYPPGDSAYDKYRAVLRVDRQNTQAKAGIEALPAKAKTLFASALTQRRNNSARGFLDAVELVRADDPDLSAMRQQLATSWLAQADQQIGESQFDSAAKSIAKARELAPADPAIATTEGKLRQARGG